MRASWRGDDEITRDDDNSDEPVNDERDDTELTTDNDDSNVNGGNHGDTVID